MSRLRTALLAAGLGLLTYSAQAESSRIDELKNALDSVKKN